MFFLETLYEVIKLSPKDRAFLRRTVFADQPHSGMVSTQGESAMRPLTVTFCVVSPIAPLASFASDSKTNLSSLSFFLSSSASTLRLSFVVEFGFFPANSFNCCPARTSTGNDYMHAYKVLPPKVLEGR